MSLRRGVDQGHVFGTVATVVLMAWITIACGREPAGSPVVTARDDGYEPSHLKIEAGETVTFVNRSRFPHSAKDDSSGSIDVSPQPGPTKHDGSEINRATRVGFATHSLFPSEAQKVVFPVAGRYTYHCAFHEMEGTIEVVAAER
jgi:plastocyanin